MSHKDGCFSGCVVSCLLGIALAFQAQARSPDQALPSSTASISSATYSPTVSFGFLPALQVATPIPGSAHVPGDFNADGTSDLLWFNPQLSQVGYWTMHAEVLADPFSSGGVTRTGARAINVTRGYFVGASGDFNGDGFADLIFTSADRDLWLWTNDHNGGFTSTRIGSYPDAWQLVGAGDINGDGYDDLLWLDPSDCEFAYWTMQGGTRIGFKVIKAGCGYYPMGIGYYTPSNRLSILWTSAAHDLYIWDSTGSSFAATDFTAQLSVPGAWAFGGGFMGQGMGVEEYYPDVDGHGYGTGYGSLYSRIFDARGNQTDFQGGLVWDGGARGGYGSGGYVIQGNSINLTGLYVIDPVNLQISTGGLSNSERAFTGNAPSPPGDDRWTYPAGWFVVGAPANGTAPLPWH